MTKVSEIYIKELFAVVKSNIRELVDIILMDIIKEAKSKQLAMYAAIIYVLLTVGQAIIDYRNCKSVIDEILKLLNLGMSKLNLGLPLFALFGAFMSLGAVPIINLYSFVTRNVGQMAGCSIGQVCAPANIFGALSAGILAIMWIFTGLEWWAWRATTQ